MSDMVKRYNESNKPRPKEARQIPGLEVNFVDRQNQFQTEYKTFRKHGDPTAWTAGALDWYKNELNTIMIPDGFVPSEQGVTLNRWTVEKKYYNPGQPSGT